MFYVPTVVTVAIAAENRVSAERHACEVRFSEVRRAVHRVRRGEEEGCQARRRLVFFFFAVFCDRPLQPLR